jgi:hypothetical protein
MMMDWAKTLSSTLGSFYSEVRFGSIVESVLIALNTPEFKILLSFASLLSLMLFTPKVSLVSLVSFISDFVTLPYF